jgi:hypothetical protein
MTQPGEESAARPKFLRVWAEVKWVSRRSPLPNKAESTAKYAKYANLKPDERTLINLD